MIEFPAVYTLHSNCAYPRWPLWGMSGVLSIAWQSQRYKLNNKPQFILLGLSGLRPGQNSTKLPSIISYRPAGREVTLAADPRGAQEPKREWGASWRKVPSCGEILGGLLGALAETVPKPGWLLRNLNCITPKWNYCK